MWITTPKEFGRDFRDLSPNEADKQKKSLYVIRFDNQQRNFNIPPKYFGMYWSADGPVPVNKVAISLWDRFLGDEEEGSRDSEWNINGEGTKEGECYSGFSCFGYGSIAISLDVEQIDTDGQYQTLRRRKNNLLKKALNLLHISECDDFDGLNKQLGKSETLEDDQPATASPNSKNPESVRSNGVSESRPTKRAKASVSPSRDNDSK